MSQKISVTLTLDDKQQAKLAEVMDKMLLDPAVRATGARVTEHMAARFVFYEALAGQGQGGCSGCRAGIPENAVETPANPAVAHADVSLGSGPTPVEVEEVEEGVAEAEVEEEAVAEEAAAEEAVAIPAHLLDKDGRYKRPLAMEFFDDNPWDLDEGQQEMHTYYAMEGWVRCAIGVGGDTVQMYWNSDPNAQDLAPFPGGDGHGRTVVARTDVALGTIHLVPPQWGEYVDPRTLGDVGEWSPG